MNKKNKTTRAEDERDAIPRIALCITGAPRMSADALPAMAKHVLSHVARPWGADIFFGIEILGTAGEVAAVQGAASVLQPKRMTVYCPATGCHANLTSWCVSPECVITQAAEVTGPPHLKSHCNQEFKATPSYELMTLKRQQCFNQIQEYEATRRHKLTYDIVSYARPDLWHWHKLSLQDLSGLQDADGIWVNGGDCGGEYTKRTKAECAVLNTRTDKRRCSAASDHMAVMYRRYASIYFGAAQLIPTMLHNRSFGCGSTFGAHSGVCDCTESMFQECMLSSWLISQAVPYNRCAWCPLLHLGCVQVD